MKLFLCLVLIGSNAFLMYGGILLQLCICFSLQALPPPMELFQKSKVELASLVDVKQVC